MAQESAIKDSATGKYLDKSPNDLALTSHPIDYFLSLLSDPLVYAQYDEDTIETDPITGQEVKHTKGEWKLNDQGQYYTETLNGRSLSGKEVVSAFDYITKEDSMLNTIDFMDSDGKQKSTVGNVAKNVAAVAPLFLSLVPGLNWLGTTYGALLVTRELAKSTNMLYGMLQTVTGQENKDSKLLNTIAAYGDKFTTSTSDYAQENTFSLENILNMISDVATQWETQMVVAKGYSKLTRGNDLYKEAMDAAKKQYNKTAKKYYDQALNREITGAQYRRFTGAPLPDRFVGNKAVVDAATDLADRTPLWAKSAIGQSAKEKYVKPLEKTIAANNKAGQDLSLAYMTIVSNYDVYDQIKQRGGSPEDAALIALGSSVGMFSVDKWLGLGEAFFQKEPYRVGLRQSARQAVDDALVPISSTAESTTKQGIVNKLKQGVSFGQKFAKSYVNSIRDRSASIVGKSIGEGLEEVTEEVMTDFSKSIASVLGNQGILFTQNDYGAFENVLERYGMSMLGGTIGGGLFGAREQWANRNNPQMQADIIEQLRNGRKDELLKEIHKEVFNGNHGSKKLSYDTVRGANGEDVFVPADENHKSQAQKNYDDIEAYINQMDAILSNNNMKQNDEDLFDKMVQGEYRAQALTDWLKGDNNINTVKNISYISKYREDVNRLDNQIVAVDQEIAKLNDETIDKDKRTKGSDYETKLANLNKQKEDLLKEREYLFGEGSLGYVEKVLFAMDPLLSGNFTALYYSQYVRDRYGKSLQDLTEAESKSIGEEYTEYLKDSKQTLDDAFRLFKKMGNSLEIPIKNMRGIDVSAEQKYLEELTEKDPFQGRLADDAPIPNKFGKAKVLDPKKDGESDADYEKRKKEHAKEVEEYNQKITRQKIIDFLKTYNEAPSTVKRRIAARMDHTIDQTLDELVNIIVKDKTDKGDLIRPKELTEKLKKAVFDGLNGTDVTSDSYLASFMNDLHDMAKGRWKNVEYESFIDALPGVRNFFVSMNVSEDILKKYGIDTSAKDLPVQFSAALNTADDTNPLNTETVTANDIALWGTMAYLNKIGKDITNPDSDYKAEDVLNYMKTDMSSAAMEMFSDSEVSNEFKSKVESAALGFHDYLASAKTNEDQGKLYNSLSSYNADSPEGSILISQGYYKPFLDKFILPAVERNFKNELTTYLENGKANSDYSEIVKPLMDATKHPAPMDMIPEVEEILQKIGSYGKLSIADFLKNVSNQYNNAPARSEFMLSPEQRKSLQKMLEDLDMAKAFIYAASKNPSQDNPVGHNKMMNAYINNHKGAFPNYTPLVELSENQGNFLINLIGQYQMEIKTWIGVDDENNTDRSQTFIEEGNALNKTLDDYYRANRSAFKIDDKHDLLDGYDDIKKTENLDVRNALVWQLIYENYQKALKDGVTLTQILDTAIPKIVTNIKQIALQEAGSISKDMTYDGLSDY